MDVCGSTVESIHMTLQSKQDGIVSDIWERAKRSIEKGVSEV